MHHSYLLGNLHIHADINFGAFCTMFLNYLYTQILRLIQYLHAQILIQVHLNNVSEHIACILKSCDICYVCKKDIITEQYYD